MFNNPQNQNAFNTQPQAQFQPQPQQNQNQQFAQFSFNNLTSSLDKVNQLQGSPQLQNLVVILKCLQVQSTESINKVCSTRQALNKNQSALNLSNLSRFKAIKQRNQELLIRLLNLREKLIHNTYMYKIRSPKVEGELDQLSEKIRHLKIIVNNKYSQLKFMKMAKDNSSKSYKKESYNYSPLTVPLNDLQKGAEIVQKESIRLREELALVIKYLHGEQI